MTSKKLKTFIITVGVVVLAYLYKKLNESPRGPIVEISSGKLQGIISLSRGGREFHDFRGIRYAAAPLGKLRFEVIMQLHCFT